MDKLLDIWSYTFGVTQSTKVSITSTYKFRGPFCISMICRRVSTNHKVSPHKRVIYSNSLDRFYREDSLARHSEPHAEAIMLLADL